MYERIFCCNDVKILVRTNEELILNSLILKFGEYYNDLSCDNHIDYVISYIVTSSIPNTKIRDCESGENCYNYIQGDEKEIKVYLPYYDSTKDNFIKRIFTTVYVKQFQKKNYCILHGACASKNGKGIIIIGKPGCGKTTLLLKLLESGYDYIANDRLAVKVDDKKTIVCGIPFSMGIIYDDIKGKIDIQDCYYIESINKIFIENKDVPVKFGINMFSKATIDCIILPIYDADSENTFMVSVKDNTKVILENIMLESAIPSQKSYLHDIIKVEYKIPSLKEIPTYEFNQGRITSEEIGQKIKRLGNLR